LLFVSLAGACARKPEGKRFELEGRVVAVDASGHILTIAHNEVAGLMPAMTMPFQVSQREVWIFGKITPGDHIHATLVMTDHADLQDISFTQGGDSAGDGSSALRIPEPGDTVPDLKFLNQSGRAIHLSQFRGKPLLLTFIYTRCPLPDFCPRISNNFRLVLQQLQATPGAFAKAQLLSVSIDPEYDSFKVLRGYGQQYAGKIDPQFQHWQFASGSPEETRKAADFFGLSYNSKGGQIVHSMQTVLIGTDGKILKVYSGNQWTPAEAVRDLVAAGG
jgi:protein SCO1/2